MLDIPGPGSTRVIEIQDKLIKNYETIEDLYKENQKTYDQRMYLQDQKILLLQGTVELLLLARETSFGIGAA